MSKPAINEHAHLREQFLSSITLLGRECDRVSPENGFSVGRVRSPVIEMSPQRFYEFEKVVSLAQNLIVECESIFGPASAFRDFLSEHELNYGTILAERQYFTKIVCFALQFEGEHYTSACRWIQPWFEGMNRSENASSVESTKKFTVQVGAKFGERADRRRPIFFEGNVFRNAFTHGINYHGDIQENLKLVINECASSEDKSSLWVERMKNTQAFDPDGFRVLSELISELLIASGILGLGKLRDFMLRNATPDGDECSKRLHNVVRDILYAGNAENSDIEIQVLAILTNEQYCQNVLVDDLLDAITTETTYYRENENNFTFTHMDKATAQLSKVFSNFRLAESDLAKISMRMAAGFTRGRVGDFRSLSVAEQLREVMAEFDKRTTPFENVQLLQFSILSAALKGMPRKTLSAVAALSSDTAKMTLYKIIGAAEFLRGMKDSKALDSVLGHDLGL